MEEIYDHTLLNKNRNYIADKDSLVFWMANCKPPKISKENENIEFFETYAQALKHGYLPREHYNPNEYHQAYPDMILKAINLVIKGPREKISNELLREKDINPYIVNQWFLNHYAISFTTFQRLYRINFAYKALKECTTYHHDNEGFAYTIRKQSQKQKYKKLKEHHTLFINRLNTPIGAMLICSSDKGICLLEFTDRKMLETELGDLQYLLSAKIIYGENIHIKQVKKEMSEYVHFKREIFDVALDTPGTHFQKQVWQSLTTIPYGTTKSYEQQAKSIDNPRAVRAVAKANGFNRISIVIPCHRVIGKDGHLTGYGGGMERKKWLIEHEKKH